jgi:hypothetical protein
MLINLKIDVTKIPKDKLFKGAKGTYLDCTVSERKNGADKDGNTHNVYIYDKEQEGRDRYLFIGSGKAYGPKTEKADTGINGYGQPKDDLPF